MGLQILLKTSLLSTLLVLLTTQQKVKYTRGIGTKDAILPLSAFKKVTAESAISCTLQCSQTKGCRSWNYYKTRNRDNCELNSRKALSTDILLRHDGGMYYQDAKEEMDCNDLGGGWWFLTCTGFHLTGNYSGCNSAGGTSDMAKKMKCVAITGINCDFGCLLRAATMKLRRNN
ncbi:uncharacterized protein LOC106175144 isoform X2 [Lingula anatina]|uniref:Uncharacterized protein LOC106175144 isoform X2 n=1 Tax=Lingula anatina TaxID=7574 RepID=A0A1S3JR32_LINAN|nr:uncharacterized protein LOC106175144 isoform X2 [Lingula anatina]|eukprot:XP_013412444.1 uncharacterized protein LOC106175144 isoform X2 [Lingula anatina]